MLTQSKEYRDTYSKESLLMPDVIETTAYEIALLNKICKEV